MDIVTIAFCTIAIVLTVISRIKKAIPAIKESVEKCPSKAIILKKEEMIH